MTDEEDWGGGRGRGGRGGVMKTWKFNRRRILLKIINRRKGSLWQNYSSRSLYTITFSRFHGFLCHLEIFPISTLAPPPLPSPLTWRAAQRSTLLGLQQPPRSKVAGTWDHARTAQLEAKFPLHQRHTKHYCHSFPYISPLYCLLLLTTPILRVKYEWLSTVNT